MKNFKILYAAGNSFDSQIQLSRCYNFIKNDNEVKIAAFKKSTPSNVKVNFSLDFLFDIFSDKYYSLETETFAVYHEQIKKFKPDLIISDLEYFTSCIGIDLSIPVWQVSPFLLKKFLTLSNLKINLNKKYFKIFDVTELYDHSINNIIYNSEENFIYSHFIDSSNISNVRDNSNFKWIRPYHELGKKSKLCEHNVVSVLLNNNKQIIKSLKKEKDLVLFSKFYNENYNDFHIKDINNTKEYYCNLQNCNIFVSEGQTSFMADAFYNNKQTFNFTNFSDAQSILNSLIAEKLKLATNLTIDPNISLLKNYKHLPLNINKSEDVKFLHEKIEDYKKS